MPIAPFQLERFFARHEFSAPFLLCASDCQTLTLGDLLDLEPGARQAFDELSLGYTESDGNPSLRAGIAGLYDGLDPDRVLVHVGAQEAIYTFACACLEPGDEVVVHMPCYQSLFQVAQSIGCVIVPWLAREEDGWRLDPDDLKRLAGPRTKAVVVNSPHNPTGACLDGSAMSAVVRRCAELGCLLFSDEVYRFLEYHDDPAPPACELYERAVSLGVMSKAYGLAGLRVGWAASRDAGVLAAMAALKDYTTICASAPSEFLAELALRHGPAILERNRALARANLERLGTFMTRHGDRLAWAAPTGGSVAFPRLASGQDAAGFCRQALEEAGVLLAPGSLFGQAFAAHFRIGFGRSGFPRALEALDDFLVATAG